MYLLRNRWRIATLVVAGALGLSFAVQSSNAYLRAGQPTVIVTLNLAKVMENLDQRADSSARLNALRDSMTKEQESRSADVKKLTDEADKTKTELEAAADPKVKKSLETKLQEQQEAAAMATLDFQAWFAFTSEKADIEAALAMQDLYRSVKTAASQMAAANGYDLVLVDDSQGEIGTNPEARVSRVDQVRQQIAGRRMLHVNPTIDITEDLIQRMNNAHKTNAPKAAAQ